MYFQTCPLFEKNTQTQGIIFSADEYVQWASQSTSEIQF